jgi:hypothetical protein
VHQKGSDYGFRFTKEDGNSMVQLRRLLELNFGDAEQTDREFDHWLKG